ncbi:MAG: SDR family oxidoreductase [Nitrospira sp.]
MASIEDKKVWDEMKIVIIGGTGLIGTQLVRQLKQEGHEVIAAAPSTGVNSLTGEGLGHALAGAAVVVDVTNAPSFEDRAVLNFFETSTKNVLAEEAKSGVGHHIALSVVGTERVPSSGYFRAKRAQEVLIEGSKIPYTIVQATQFFEFLGAIADVATQGTVVRVPPALIQPIAAADVALGLAQIAVALPTNRTIAIAGPEAFRFEAIIKQVLTAHGDHRQVVEDPGASYFGGMVDEKSLVPAGEALLGSTRFQSWVNQSTSKAGASEAVVGVRS